MPSASERRLVAQIAAHQSWANTPDPTARTAPARTALLAKFLQEAGGDPIRAEHLRLAYYKRLALKSAVARRKAKEFTAQAEAAEAELPGWWFECRRLKSEQARMMGPGLLLKTPWLMRRWVLYPLYRQPLSPAARCS